MFLFSPSGSYLGKYQKTDENGNVSFEVPEAEYKIRADYMGYQFWTDDTMVSTDTSIDLTLPHKDVVLTVSGVYQNSAEPVTDVKVYLFSPSGSYLGQYRKTDENGQVLFSLPDQPYKVRVDYMGQHFWSEEFTGQDTPVNIASAMAQVTVTGSGLPQAGLNVYLFSETGSYLGSYLKTDTNGQVQFRLPQGKYKFRADYEGSRFWSPVSALAPDMVNPVEVSVGGGRFEFSARTDSGDPITGSKCYVFTQDKSYIGLYGVTDAGGKTSFDLADGTYLFRFDYMGEHFWSEPVTVPDQLSYEMTIAHELARITVATKNDPVKNAKVYLFSETGSYLGQYGKTDDSGAVSFYLPVGVKYRFRADVLGSKQWSETVQIADTGTNEIYLSAGGGLLTAVLQTDTLVPITGIKMYLFTESGSYTGQYQKTDTDGRVAFEVPNAAYKVRADYLGYQFWTDAAVISDDTFLNLTLPHKNTQITLQSHYQGSYDPLPGIKMYLFNSSGSYLGQYFKTDENGQVSFLLPDKEYKVRADYIAEKFWTEPFRFLDTTLAIDHGKVQIKVLSQGTPANGVNVYLFNESGVYLGTCIKTDENGLSRFLVPADHAYKFRVDTNGGRYWSDVINIISDQEYPMEVEVAP